MTPTFTRNGSRADGLPVEAQLTIQCVEVPEHNRLQTGRLTALDAAKIEDFFSNTSKLEYLRSISFEKYDEKCDLSELTLALSDNQKRSAGHVPSRRKGSF